MTTRAAQRAFTLIELLVVLVILGVIVAAATLSVGVLGGDRELEDQARRFAAVLEQTREEAELQGLDVGVVVAADAYQYFRYDPRRLRWEPIEHDPLYAMREIPEGVRFRLWVESREIILKPDLPQYDEKDPDKLLPQITVLSSGDVNPFELRMEREGGDTRWRVVANPDNTIVAEVIGNERR